VNIIDGSSITIDPDTLAITGVTPEAPSTTLPSDSFFQPAAYYGAVDPASTASTAWWAGWTARNSAFEGNLPGSDFHPLEAEITDGTITPAADNGCAGLGFTAGGSVDVFGVSFPVCVIENDITSDLTLVNNHVFVLATTISVGDGQDEGGAPNALNVTLTIPAGTQIYASQVGGRSSLVATRGSQIVANGTADQPIIFAAVPFDAAEADVITGDPTDISGRGDWGGLILSGYGIINNADQNNETLSEASPEAAPRAFGGTDNADSSGSLNYVIIAETGFAFRDGAEVQGLTLEAVGSGTTLDYIQIISSDDDCVEWFGGAANASHLVCNAMTDDALDMDLGYVGNVQFALIRLGETSGERGIEADNNENNNDQMPRTTPNIANITVLGNSGRSDAETLGAMHRSGFGGKVFRSVFTDDIPAGGEFESGCLNIDDSLPMELEHFDSVFNCSGGDANGLAPPDDGD